MSTQAALRRDLRLLLGTFPDPATSYADRAAWFDRKADLLDRLAVHTVSVNRAEIRELAERARLEARRLLVCDRLERGGRR